MDKLVIDKRAIALYHTPTQGMLSRSLEPEHDMDTVASYQVRVD